MTAESLKANTVTFPAFKEVGVSKYATCLIDQGFKNVISVQINTKGLCRVTTGDLGTAESLVSKGFLSQWRTCFSSISLEQDDPAAHPRRGHLGVWRRDRTNLVRVRYNYWSSPRSIIPLDTIGQESWCKANWHWWGSEENRWQVNSVHYLEIKFHLIWINHWVARMICWLVRAHSHARENREREPFHAVKSAFTRISSIPVSASVSASGHDNAARENGKNEREEGGALWASWWKSKDLGREDRRFFWISVLCAPELLRRRKKWQVL